MEWPKKQPVRFLEWIVDPLVSALRQGYRLQRRKRQTLVYEGLDVISTQSNLARRLSARPYRTFDPEMLQQQEEEGRDLLWVIINLAVQLGVEQGRRLERRNSKKRKK